MSRLTSLDQLLNVDQKHRKQLQTRLLKKVYKDRKTTTCWIWLGSCFASNSRARTFLGAKSVLASRVFYILYKGKIGNNCVLHTCDNVKCVNPKHLILGTNADNSEDMVKKKRSAWGERNARAVLTLKQAKDIKRRSNNGERRIVLAREYGVTEPCISDIALGKSWKHLGI